jgi:carboxymethylenebutenolidase
MSDLFRYLTTEIAADYADGHLPRREALRRLGLMGLSAAASASLLAGCGSSTPAIDPSDREKPGCGGWQGENLPDGPVAPSASASAEPPPAQPVARPEAKPTELIRWTPASGGTSIGAFAAADSPRGAVLVIHENKGLNAHTREVAGRLAQAGYTALAVDLLAPEGGTEALGEPANATAALAKAPPERLLADARAGIDELARRAPGKKLGVVGFCFGGAMTWRLIASKDPRIVAAAPFYGPMPEGADFTGSKAAVLGVFAEVDDRVNATRDAAKAALVKAGLAHEVVTFAGQHAFMNDTGPRYHAESAALAWAKLIAWFGAHLG